MSESGAESECRLGFNNCDLLTEFPATLIVAVTVSLPKAQLTHVVGTVSTHRLSEFLRSGLDIKERLRSHRFQQASAANDGQSSGRVTMKIKSYAMQNVTYF